MSSSGQVKLKEFAELVNQPYQPSSDENINYIGLEHIEQQTLRLNGIGNSSDVISQKHKFRAGDILFGKLRPYFRKVVRPSFDGVCSTDIWVVRAKPGFDQSFLFYFLANKSFIDECNSSSSGTRMPRADWNHLSETLWELPTLPEQKRIAEILSALDDKIELNRQTNVTLEAIAQAIFKEWFVDFNYPGATGELVDTPLGPIPKGWQVGCLKDIVELANETISPGKLPDTLFSHYSIPAFDSGRIPLEELGSSILSNKFIVKRNSVLVSKLNPRFPRIWPIKNVVQTTSICSTEFQVLLPKKYYYHSFVYNLFYQNFMVETMKSMVSGTSSSHQRVDPKFLLKISIILPTDDIVCDYENIVGDYLTFIENNIQEAVNLRTIRDNLLLNLMNGEIEV